MKSASRTVVEAVFGLVIIATGSTAAAIVGKHGIFWASVAWLIGAMLASNVLGRARSRWRVRNRNTQLAACAQWLELHYSADTIPPALGKVFFLSRKGTTPLKGVIWGDWNGLPIIYHECRSAIIDGQMFFFSVLRLHLSITAPYIEVSRKARIRFARLAKVRGAPEADLDTGSFSREFRVKSKDDQFAQKLMDTDMMAWMLSESPKFRFEISGHQLVVSYPIPKLQTPSILPALLNAAAGFATHIPRVVLDDYATE